MTLQFLWVYLEVKDFDVKGFFHENFPHFGIFARLCLSFQRSIDCYLSPVQATQYFLDKKLHTSCWSRARRCYFFLLLGGRVGALRFGGVWIGQLGAVLEDVEK